MMMKHFKQYHEESIIDKFAIHTSGWRLAIKQRRTFLEDAAYHASKYIDIYPSALVTYLRKYYKNTKMEDWDDQWVGEIFKTTFIQNGYCTYRLYTDSRNGQKQYKTHLRQNEQEGTDKPSNYNWISHRHI
jgi:hypothetical protein